MTSYQPNPVVTFADVNVYSEHTIANISINMGRDNVLDQPQAGYSRIVLWTDANEPLNVNLSDSVKVEIDNGTAGTSTIFTGIISDIDISLAQFGNIGSVAEYTLTAVGPLAQLNKRIAGATGYAKEFDGTRIFNILSDAFLTSWDDVGSTLTWNDLPNDVTWASYDGVNETLVNNLTSTIDTPGQFELAAYSSGGGGGGGATNALSLANIAAQSGRGVLYESGDGSLYYGDYASRTGQTPLELSANDLLTDGLSTAAQWSDIVNDAEVIYHSGSEFARDEQSVILYGQLSGSRSTVLHNASDALQQAEDFITSRAYPRVYPNNLTIALHNPEVSDATRDALIAAENGREINTNALPAVFGSNFNGFIEGYTWNLTRYEAVITLICSAVSETYPHIIWYQIPPTTTWVGYTPSTDTWSDL
jgi:hypothetical protein